MKTKFYCSTCGTNANHTCINSQVPYQKSIKSYSNSLIKYFALERLGRRYKFKQKSVKKINQLKKYCFTLNNFQRDSDSLMNYATLYMNHFSTIHKSASFILRKKSLKIKNLAKLMKLFNILMPTSFLTTRNNKQLFKNIIKACVTASKYENIYEEVLYTGFDLDLINWIPQHIANDMKQNLLVTGLKLVLVYILIPVFNKFFQKVHSHSYEYTYFPRIEYKKAVCKMIAILEKSKYIKRIYVDRNSLLKNTAYIMLKPKVTNIQQIDMTSFRIIAILPKRVDNTRAIRVEINQALNLIAINSSFVKQRNFFGEWSSFIAKYKNHRLFMVKLDIRDCFGNISIDLLESQIKCSLLSYEHKKELLQACKYQYVTFGKRGNRPIIWKWNHGLLQGMRFSHCLCVFYLAQRETIHFAELNKPTVFIYRDTDDYFFASTKAADCIRFLEKAKEIFSINEQKTQGNIFGQATEYINFVGMRINMKTFRIKCAYDTSTELSKKFRFWNEARRFPKHTIIDKAIFFDYNNFYFKPVFMSIKFNGISHVLQNFYESMTFLAYKLDAVVSSVTFRQFKSCHEDKILDVTLQSAKYYSKRVLNLNLAANTRVHLLRQKLNLVAIRAFVNVFKKCRNEVYMNIVQKIEGYIQEEMLKHPLLIHFLSTYRTIPKDLKVIKTWRTFKIAQL